MAKFHRKGGKQTAVRKKLSEKKRKTRRDRQKVPVELKAKGLHPPFKNRQTTATDENRLQRVKDIKQIQKNNRSNVNMENRGLSGMLLNAEERGSNFVESAEKPDIGFNARQIFKSCYKEFKKVIDAADVIIEVLDARDPLGSRCQQVEQSVISAGASKRLILLLNKIDLIPRENLEQWLKYLRQEFPTVAFKASTQSQNDNLSQTKVAAIHLNENLQSSSCCFGANFLMKVLGNYCRNQNILTSIKVGVVGYPNVGKSSVINSLKRSRACVVGGTPGVTKTMQEIILDKHIRILDSPGVVFAKEGSKSALALQNALNIGTLEDVVTPAEAIVQRADHQQLIDHYGIPKFSSLQELLFLLGKKIGRFLKGGVPDPDAAARKLLNDWNSGVIKFFTHPPEIYQPTIQISAEIVQEMSKAFDISALEERMELDKMSTELPEENPVCEPGSDETETMEVAAVPPREDKAEQRDASSHFSVKFDVKKEDKLSHDTSSIKIIHFQKNKQKRKQFKQMKKKRRRNERVAGALAESMNDALSLL